MISLICRTLVVFGVVLGGLALTDLARPPQVLLALQGPAR